MTQKNRTLEGKNRTLGGEGSQKLSKIVGHHLCTFPKPKWPRGEGSSNASETIFFFSVIFISEVPSGPNGNLSYNIYNSRPFYYVN